MVDFAKSNKQASFRNYLEELLKSKKMGEQSETEDGILADYLLDCLKAFEKAIKKRDESK